MSEDKTNCDQDKIVALKGRILARRLACELTKEELNNVTGGRPCISANSSCAGGGVDCGPD